MMKMMLMMIRNRNAVQTEFHKVHLAHLTNGNISSRTTRRRIRPRPAARRRCPATASASARSVLVLGCSCCSVLSTGRCMCSATYCLRRHVCDALITVASSRCGRQGEGHGFCTSLFRQWVELKALADCCSCRALNTTRELWLRGRRLIPRHRQRLALESLLPVRPTQPVICRLQYTGASRGGTRDNMSDMFLLKVLGRIYSIIKQSSLGSNSAAVGETK